LSQVRAAREYPTRELGRVAVAVSILIASIVGVGPCVAGGAEPLSGTVAGTITYRGRVPKVTQPDMTGAYRDLVAVDRKSGGLSDAVVYVGRVDHPADRGGGESKGVEPPTVPDGAGENPAAQIDQVQHVFEPHVVVIRDGEAIRFTNSDSGNHHLRTTAREAQNRFNTYTGPEGSYTHRFVAEGDDGPVVLGCDIHLWMRAWIFVFRDERAAVTDKRGRFEIAGLTPGRYRLHVCQPDGGLSTTRDLVIEPGESTQVQVAFERADLGKWKPATAEPK